MAFAQYYPYGLNYFIFGGLYQVKKLVPEIYDQVGYELTLLNNFIGFRKRLIIKLEISIGRNLYNRWFEHIQSTLNPEIYELALSTKLGSFPGYDNILLTHKELQSIIRNEAPEWKKYYLV